MPGRGAASIGIDNNNKLIHMASRKGAFSLDSAAARWTALIIVSVTMMFAYFFTDVMSPLEPLLTTSVQDGGLGWSSDE